MASSIPPPQNNILSARNYNNQSVNGSMKNENISKNREKHDYYVQPTSNDGDFRKKNHY